MNASCSPLRIRVPNLIQAGIQFSRWASRCMAVLLRSCQDLATGRRRG
jgi:hypothetical protein